MHTIDGPRDAVQPVKFKKDRRDKLLAYLKKEHVAVEGEREGMKSKWEVWVKQANSRLNRTDGGPRDSKLDMTLTRERMFQNAARLQTPLFQQPRVMAAKARTPGPESDQLNIDVEDLMDFIVDRADAMRWSDEWVEQFQVLPFGVVKTAFVHEVRHIKRWEEIGIDDYEALSEIEGERVSKRKLKDGTFRYFREIPDTSTVRSGCFPEVIPAEDFLFPDAPSVDTAAWVTHRIWMSRSTLEARVREGMYAKKTADGDSLLEAIGNPSGERTPLLGVHEDDKGQDVPSGKRYEIYETYLSYDVDGDGKEEEIIVTWERSKGLLLRAVHNFYHAYERPFVVHQYRPVQGSMYGIPLTFFLEPLHRAYAASINQRLDAASKALETLIFVPPGHPMLKQGDRNYVRGGIYENPGYTKDDLIQFRVSEPSFSQLPDLEQIFEHRADRISHLAPESFGEHTQDRPTATGTLEVLEEGRQPQYLQLERYRKSFAKVVKHMLARYQQFYPEGLRFYVQQETPQGQQLIDKFFSWPDKLIEDEVIVETQVSSATMSKSLRKQEMVAMLDKLPMIYQQLYQLSELASNPQNPAAMIAVQLLKGLQVAVDKFMSEFEIGRKEELNPDLSRGIDVAQNFAMAIQQLQQALQQAQGQIQKLTAENAQKDQILSGGGMAGPPVPPPGMAGPPELAGQ